MGGKFMAYGAIAFATLGLVAYAISPEMRKKIAPLKFILSIAFFFGLGKN